MSKSLRAAALITGLTLTILAMPSAGAQEPSLNPGEPSMFNLEHVYNLNPGGSPYVGTDLAFWTATVPLRDYQTGALVDADGNPLPDGEPAVLAERDFAVMGNTGGSNPGGYVFDITDPENIELATVVECNQQRNDPSVVHTTDGSGDPRVLLVLADEEGGSPVCIRSPRVGDPHLSGVSVFDVTDPLKWKPLYSAQADGGGHTATAHPTKPFVWLSTGDLPGAANTSNPGFNHIPILDLTNADDPKLLDVEVKLGGPHNIEFSADGERAYVANENHYEIWDSTDPGNPVLISEHTVNPGTYAHGAWGTNRDVMITNNESLALGGFFVAGTGICPGEGLGFYDIEGSNEQNPIPVGYFEPPLVGRTPDDRACTSHFGNVGPSGEHFAVGWYIGGARIVDFSNPSNPTEIAHAVMEGAESWTAKFYKGPYVYVGDIVRGFDVFRWSGDGPAPWLGDEAAGEGSDSSEEESADAAESSQVTGLQASADGSVTGSAAFGGQAPVKIAEDFPGDAPVHAEHSGNLGLDLLDARAFRPDPNDPAVWFEWRVTKLPDTGTLPEVIRYVITMQVDGKQHQLQAKLTNLTSVTLVDDPASHARAPAFQLRGNCVSNWPVPESPLANCPHVDWLDGEFDVENATVRIRLPFGITDQIQPGAVLKPLIIGGSIPPVYAAYQAVASNSATWDGADWFEEDPYTIPDKEVSLGVAPAGTDPAQVAFDTAATLDEEGGFSGSLDLSGLAAGDYEVFARACFADNCGVASVPLTI